MYTHEAVKYSRILNPCYPYSGSLYRGLDLEIVT